MRSKYVTLDSPDPYWFLNRRTLIKLGILIMWPLESTELLNWYLQRERLENTQKLLMYFLWGVYLQKWSRENLCLWCEITISISQSWLISLDRFLKSFWTWTKVLKINTTRWWRTNPQKQERALMNSSLLHLQKQETYLKRCWNICLKNESQSYRQCSILT